MTIEHIYRAYTESANTRQDPELEAAMYQILDGLRDAGINTMRAEEQLNAILDRQEAVAFQAGFREAFELFFSA